MKEIKNDSFSEALLKTLNSVYKDFALLANKGSIYIFGYKKDSFKSEIPKEGGDVDFCFIDKDVVAVDKNCVKPFTKKYLIKTNGWRIDFENIDKLKGFTAGCLIFSYLIKQNKNKTNA